MESDSIPKIDLVLDNQPIGQLGLANQVEADENTDYSDSEAENEDISIGAPKGDSASTATPKRSSARIKLSDKAGNLHKRTRYA